MAQRYDEESGEWYDDGTEDHLSPWEEAHGGHEYDPNSADSAPNDFDAAIAEYYGYGGGSPVDQQPETNWYQPDTYEYLVNQPGGTTPPPGGAPAPTGSTPTYRAGTGPMAQGYSGSNYGGDWRQATDLLGPVPKYSAPALPTIDPFTYDPWTPPQFEDIYKDGTYQGRKREGEQALMNSKAAQGMARSGMALKDLLAYNQDFAGREYGNIFDRGRTTYTTNRGNAFDNWRANADTTLRRAGMEQDRAWDEYTPLLTEWSTKGNVGQRGAEFAANMRRNTDNDVFDRLRWLSEFDRDSAMLGA